MTSPQPKVSIVVPVYNGANYMRQAIDSALGQTYRNFEVIVVNDGSRDDGATERIALEYGTRIRYIAKENGRVSSALNRAIEVMQGDYFSWLSHDDVYLPHKLATQVAMLEGLSDKASVLWSDWEQIDASGRRIRVHHAPDYEVPGFRYAMLMSPSIHGCTLLVPRVCFEVCGTFRQELFTTQDYALWFAIAGRFPFVHCPQVLVQGRSHAAQSSHTILTHQAEKEQLFGALVDQYVDEDLSAPHIDPVEKSRRCLTLSRALLQHRLPGASSRAFRHYERLGGWRESVRHPDLLLGLGDYGRIWLRRRVGDYLRARKQQPAE